MEKTKKINAKGIIAVLVLSAFIATFNETILNVALSNIMEDFNISSGTAQWIITGYMIITSVMVPITAFLIESFRTKQIFFGAMTLLLIGTILCAISNSFPMLLISRMVQAAGTGMMIPIMMNTVLIVSPKEKIGSYMSICICAITLGPAFSPTISGIMLQYFSWHVLFIALIPILILITILGACTLSDVSKLTYPKLDFISVILSTLGLASLIYGINIISSGNIKAITISLLLGIILIGTFVVRQGKLKEPMLNLTPLKQPDFVMGVLLIMISMMTVFTMNVMLPMYMEGSLGVSSFIAALALLPAVLCNGVLTTIAGKIYDKKGIKVLAPSGLIVATIFVFLLSRAESSTPLTFIIVVYALVYMGVAFVMSPTQTYSLSNLSKEYYPHGVAIVNTLQQVSAAIGSSLFIGIMSAGQEKALSTGSCSVEDAIASGFSEAALVNGIIVLIGVVISLVLVSRKKKVSQ